MNYIRVIREGISTVNHSWQLVIAHLISAILSFLSFFLIVGIPISIAFVMFGLDLTEILRLKDLTELIRSSFGLLKKYFAMAIVIITSLLFYFTFIFTLWLFTIAGSAGTLSSLIKNETSKFTSKIFFSEGKRLFASIFGFSALVSIILMFFAFLLGILGGGISSIIEIAKNQETVLALFLGIFFAAIIFVTGIFSIVIVLSFVVYGIAHIALNKISPLTAFKQTLKYLYKNPSSVGFFSILLIASTLAIFTVFLLGSPIVLIPFLGPFLSPLYQLASTLIQAYINLVVLASAFNFYYKTGYIHPQAFEGITPSGTADLSKDAGISQKSDVELVQSPQKSAENQQKQF